MITKLARLEFELFTKPSNSDFLRNRLYCGAIFLTGFYLVSVQKYKLDAPGQLLTGAGLSRPA